MNACRMPGLLVLRRVKIFGQPHLLNLLSRNGDTMAVDGHAVQSK